jgi:thioredoxin 1
MQTSTKITLGMMGVLFVAGIVFAIFHQTPSPETRMSGSLIASEAMTEVGSYEPYASEKIARAKTGDVVLFFRASWCPTCRALDTDIRAHLSEIPHGLTILDVNYDDSSALKQKYDVTYQHTLVQVDADGNQIAKWSGSPTLAALAAQVQ